MSLSDEEVGPTNRIAESLMTPTGNETRGNETTGNESAGNEARGNETAGNEARGNETRGNEMAEEAGSDESPDRYGE